MAYQKQNFKDGDVLTAAQLIKMEDGIIESNFDLVVGLNLTNANVENLDNLGVSDITIESGNVASVAEKVKNGIPVRVLLKELHFYAGNNWSRGVAEASHVMVGSLANYPSDNYSNLILGFFLINLPMYYPRGRSFTVSFNIATGVASNVESIAL